MWVTSMRYKLLSVKNTGEMDVSEVDTQAEVVTALGVANVTIDQALFWAFDSDPAVNTWFLQQTY